MIRILLASAASVAVLATASAPALAQTPVQTPVQAPEAAQPADPSRMSLRDLAMMERVGDPRLSPDGRRVLYSVRTTDWEGNRGVNAVWLAPVDGSAPPRRLNVSTGGAASARWAPDGRAVYFLSSRGGSSQVWRTDTEGNAAAQVTALPLDVTAFKIAPDGRSLVLAVAVFTDCDTLQCTRDRMDERARAVSTVRVYERLPLRPWDSWNDGRRNHLFLQALNGSGLGEGQPRDLMPGVDADVPGRPQGGEESFVVSPDGRHIYYSTQTQGRTEAFTSDSDLFRVAVAGGAPVNLTPGNPAYDGAPAVSPDGRRLAWLAGRRENVGGDQARVMVADADGSNPRELLGDWDRGPSSLRWASDGRSLLTTASENGQFRLFRIDAATGAVAALTGDGSVAGLDEAGGVIVYGHERFTTPTQIHVRDARGQSRVLTAHNAEALARLDLPEPEPFTFAGWNGEPVQGWVFRPAGFAEGQRYPAVHLIHGGPKSPWTDSWSYRWNPQTYTAAGYAVVMVNFHGSPGFGQAFTDAINDHWGDRPLEDLEKGWAAALAANPWIDGDRACALGASYGGYMVNMIAGRSNEGWRCLVNHAGVFDVPQLMNAMDIGNFIWEFGGPSWERKDVYDRHNPETYAGNWSRPMLVLHGSRDFRVPEEQGLATFSTLQRLGIPSRYVHVPDENHWILKPRNWVDWQQEILTWVGEWTAREP